MRYSGALLLGVVALCCLTAVFAAGERKDLATCRQPKKVGPCKARKVRFYFDTKSSTCRKFNYGGCRGNTNNFKTKSACEKRCGKKPTDKKPNVPKKPKKPKKPKGPKCRLKLPAIPSRCADSKFNCDKQHIRHYCSARENVCRKVKKRCIKSIKTCSKWSRITKTRCVRWVNRRKCKNIKYYQWHHSRGARTRKCKYFFRYKTKMVNKKILSRRVCTKRKKIKYLSRRNRKICSYPKKQVKKCEKSKKVRVRIGKPKRVRVEGCKGTDKKCTKLKWSYKTVTKPGKCKIVTVKGKKKVCRLVRVWLKTTKCVARQRHMKTVQVPKKVRVPDRKCGPWYRPKVRVKKLKRVRRCQTTKICARKRKHVRRVCVTKRNTCVAMSNVCTQWKSTCKETKTWCTRVKRFCGQDEATRAIIYAGRLNRAAKRLARKCGGTRTRCRRVINACYKRCDARGSRSVKSDCRRKCDKQFKKKEKACWQKSCDCTNAEKLIKMARSVKDRRRVDA